MPACRHLLWCAALSLLVLAAAAIPAGAKPTLFAISDGTTMTASQLAQWTSQTRGSCPRKATSVESMSLATALSHINKQLQRSASAKALRAFARSKDARTAVTAADGIFAGLAEGKPWAAIDAALRVHQLAPRDAGPLITLAGLVAAQGMPQEALALLDAAKRWKASGTGPMGISFQAIANNNRGYALILLGNPRQAQRYLRGAMNAAPALSEARINLDPAQQCQWVMLPGGSRGNPPVIADPPFTREDSASDWTTDDQGNPVSVTSDVYDLSQGTQWAPIEIALPESPDEAEAMGGGGAYYDLVAAQLQYAADADDQQAQQLENQVKAPNLQTQERQAALVSALGAAEWQPDLKPLFMAVKTQIDSLDQASRPGGELDPAKPYSDAQAQFPQCDGSPDPNGCEDQIVQQVCVPERQQEFTQWISRMKELNDSDLRWEDAYWQYATGVAANSADPALNKLLQLSAESEIMSPNGATLGASEPNPYPNRYGVVTVAFEWTTGLSSCQTTPPQSPSTGNLPTEQDSPACPKQLDGWKAAVEIDELFKIGVKCDEISFEAGTGWLGPFTNVTFNRHGQVTVFAGVQAGAGGSGIQEGAFVVAGPGGNIVDGGLRISGTASAGAGPVSYERSATLNIAVAGVVPFTEGF